MTTKTPESLLNEAFISEDVCMESLRSVIQKHNERVREALHELDQLRARVSELEAENARLRLAAIEDAKDHDRRVTECERWADRLKEVERERDEAKRTISVVRSNEALADTEFEGMRKDKETAEAAATELAGQLDDLRQELKAMEDTERRQRAKLEEVERERDVLRETLGIRPEESIPAQTPQRYSILVDSAGTRRRISPATDNEMEIALSLQQAEQQRDAATEALKGARVAIEQILAAYKLGGGFALVEAIQTEIARQDAAAALAAAETDK